MATVTTTPATPAPVDTGSLMQVVFAPIHWFFDHFVGLLLVTFVAVGIGVCIYLYVSEQERKKELEDMLYKEYKDTIRSCGMNQNPLMYTKKYSKVNLFWLGLPFIHNKFGRKIYNKRQEFVGYYDGMFIDYLGNYNIKAWKDKSFIFFKNHFILRLPTNTFTVREEITSVKNKSTGRSKEKKNYVVASLPLPDGLVNISEFDKTIHASMVNHIKKGFYYFPVYEDRNSKILNLTETINAMDRINHSDNLLQQVIRESGKAVIGMAKVNTGLVYDQRVPEKVKDVDKDE